MIYLYRRVQNKGTLQNKVVLIAQKKNRFSPEKIETYPNVQIEKRITFYPNAFRIGIHQILLKVDGIKTLFSHCAFS